MQMRTYLFLLLQNLIIAAPPYLSLPLSLPSFFLLHTALRALVFRPSSLSRRPIHPVPAHLATSDCVQAAAAACKPSQGGKRSPVARMGPRAWRHVAYGR